MNNHARYITFSMNNTKTSDTRKAEKGLGEDQYGIYFWF